MKTRLKIQLSAFGGIVSPLIFLAVSTLDGFTRPGYDPARNFISRLSNGPDGWIQIANFIAVGLGILAFSWGMRVEFREGRASRAGPLLIAIIGIGFLGAGLFVVDPRPHTVMSLSHDIHIAFARFGIFVPMPIACFVFARRFEKDRRWRGFTWPTVIVGAFTIPMMFTPYTTSRWPGLFQRLHIGLWLFWMVAVAIRMRVLAELDKGKTIAPPPLLRRRIAESLRPRRGP